jgi:hypothetical protein
VFSYNPGPQGSVEGTPVVLPLHFVDSDPAQTLSYAGTTLPPGLSVNHATGTVSGTPTTPGTYSAAVTALDTSGQTSIVAFTWTIGNPGISNSVFFFPAVSTTLRVGQNITMQDPAGDSDPSQILYYAAAGLPPGVSINPVTGLISGSPATPGTYQATLTATDSTGAIGQITLPWTVLS